MDHLRDQPFADPQLGVVELAGEDAVFACLCLLDQVGELARIAVWLRVVSAKRQDTRAARIQRFLDDL